MTPPLSSRRPNCDRIPLSPAKQNQNDRIPLSPAKHDQNIASQTPFFEVPPFPGVIDKENYRSSDVNEQIFEDDVNAKPILITLDYDDCKPPPKKQASLGRPPKMCTDSQQKAAPKVRLCSELAGHAVAPFCVFLFMACIMAASHSDEDHSYSSVKRAITNAAEELYDSESLTVWLLVLTVLIVVIVGIICTYVWHSAASSARANQPKKVPERSQERPAAYSQDSTYSSLHSLSRRRTAGTAALYA